jgi:hypothetical protein
MTVMRGERIIGAVLARKGLAIGKERFDGNVVDGPREG